MKSVIFYNPKYQKKDWDRITDLQQALKKSNIECLLTGDSKQLASIQNSLIWIFGGDGTLHHVINSSDTTGNYFAFMGGGSGNDCLKNFSRETIHQMIGKYKSGQFTNLDLWQCNGIKFINAGSVGFSAKVADSANRGIINFGFLKYAIPVLQHLPVYRVKSYEMQTKKRSDTRLLFLAAFGNGAFVGGGFNLFPGAVLNDNELNFITIDKPTLLQKIRYLLKVKKGKHLSLPVCTGEKVKELLIKSTNEQTIMFELDGEIYENKQLEINRCKEGLKVLNSLQE